MLNPEHLKVTVIDPSPKGGQTTGLTWYVVEVEHLPTRLIARCGAERSQLKNKKVAMAMIEYGLAEMGWTE